MPSGTRHIDPSRFIGRQFGSVTLLSMIGMGASSVVFSGFQRSLQRRVAVKIMLKNERAGTDERELFRQEARIIAALHHPNIIPIYDMGEDEECYYQVIQIVQGPTLETVIRNRLKNPLPHRRILPLDETLGIITKILDGLGYAHDEGLVHQDMKPANILMEQRRNEPLIVDFGIAKTRFQQVWRKGVIVGSPLYMAPEQIENMNTDRRSDIYSVGIMLFQMLAGRLPIAVEEPMALLSCKLKTPEKLFTKRPAESSPLIDGELERVILTATAARPDARYDDCTAFRRELETAAGR